MASTDEPLFSLETRDVVARLARRCLDHAADGLRRLKDSKDVDALHEFRVSVRRLRSLLRAYRPWMGRSASKKMRGRLADLAQATNADRDAQVQVVWLEAQRDSLRRCERAGLNCVLDRLGKIRGESNRQIRRRVRAEFETVDAVLRTRLANEVAENPRPFVQAFGELLGNHASDLEGKLSKVRRIEDETEAHAARISAKRLRYLIEPVLDELADGRSRMVRLKQLQDLLGELNDMHVLAATLRATLDEVAPEKAERLHELVIEGRTGEYEKEGRRDVCCGIIALTARVRARRNELFAALQAEWLGGRAADFTQPLRLEGEALDSAA